MSQSSRAAPVRRRTVLASLATAGTALSSGCIRRLRTLTGWQSSGQLSLRIKTVPGDADPYSQDIARHLAGWYRTAGIDAGVVPMAEEELLRQVLLNHEFDVFVARIPQTLRDPDGLYSLLHSEFTPALGWQNPFGYSNLEVDELLERQRRTGGSRRREAVVDLQRSIARTQPFTVIAIPDQIRAARSDLYANLQDVDLGSPTGYLTLTSAERDGEGEGEASDEKREHPTVVTTDPRATESLNPLAVESRRIDLLIGLLYDSLGYRSGLETIDPWLAASWEFVANDDAPVARVRLREDLVWHDGEPLTASDVTFTYAFLADTSSGTEEDSVPPPRFQGRSSLVADTNVIDRRTLDVEFVECDPAVATRAFTVPVLPKHVWAKRTEPVSTGGIGPATEALTTDNVPAVGSGPFSFVHNTPKESVTLARFEEHFLLRDDVSGVPPALAGGPEIDRLTVRVARSDVMAVEMIVSGDADLTATPIGANLVPRIEGADLLELLVDPSSRYYLVGYNVRRPSLANPRFRTALAHLVDKSHLAENVFDGYARPATSPLAGTDWVPADLEWTGTDPETPFLGSDGDLDVERVRDVFREAGYRYDGKKLIKE
ncbi:MAG: ABC transporter substrate-binding protein [Halanaeroarchaeum sp.]